MVIVLHCICHSEIGECLASPRFLFCVSQTWWVALCIGTLYSQSPIPWHRIGNTPCDQPQDNRSVFLYFSLLCWGEVSRWTWLWLFLLASLSHGCSMCASWVNAEIAHGLPLPRLWRESWASELWSSHFCGKHFTQDHVPNSETTALKICWMYLEHSFI